METKNFYEELRVKYQTEDRAKMVMQQIKAYQEGKQNRKWWQKIGVLRNVKTKPKPWSQNE